jgi:hypothetical protein
MSTGLLRELLAQVDDDAVPGDLSSRLLMFASAFTAAAGRFLTPVLSASSSELSAPSGTMQMDPENCLKSL